MNYESLCAVLDDYAHRKEVNVRIKIDSEHFKPWHERLKSLAGIEGTVVQVKRSGAFSGNPEATPFVKIRWYNKGTYTLGVRWCVLYPDDWHHVARFDIVDQQMKLPFLKSPESVPVTIDIKAQT